MKKCAFSFLLVALLLMSGAEVALALTFQFDGDSHVVAFEGSGGLKMAWGGSIDTTAFDLNVGESMGFGFGSLWSTEKGTELSVSGDTTPQVIEAFVDFLLPEIFGGSVPGTSVGTIGGQAEAVTQGWNVVWSDPVDLFFGSGGLVRLELDDIFFTHGDWDYQNVSVPLTGMVTYVQSPVTQSAPVPEPATMALFGAGVGLLGLARRRKKS